MYRAVGKDMYDFMRDVTRLGQDSFKACASLCGPHDGGRAMARRMYAGAMSRAVGKAISNGARASTRLEDDACTADASMRATTLAVRLAGPWVGPINVACEACAPLGVTAVDAGLRRLGRPAKRSGH